MPESFAKLGKKVKFLRCVALSLVCGAGACLPAASVAQDWIFQPTISVGGEYNDNIRLRDTVQQPGSEDDDVTGGVADVEARIERRSPTGSITLLPRIRASYYGSDSDADSTDYYLDTFWHHEGQRSRWSLTARFAEEEVLNAELNDPDFDNPDVELEITDDSGFVSVENTRSRAVVYPRAEFNLTQRTRLGLGARYMDISYDNSVSTLSDYENYYGDTWLSHSLSERVTVTFRAFGGRYEPEGQATETDSYGGTMEFTSEITERYTGFLMAGYQEAEIEDTSGGMPTTVSDGAVIFGAGVTREYDVSRIVLDLRRTVDPSGIGQLIERNQARARFTHDLSELTTVSLTARYQQTVGLLADTANADRDYLRGELELERHLTRNWSITGRYRYTRQEFDQTNETESSNDVFLGVKYQPPVPE